MSSVEPWKEKDEDSGCNGMYYSYILGLQINNRPLTLCAKSCTCVCVFILLELLFTILNKECYDSMGHCLCPPSTLTKDLHENWLHLGAMGLKLILWLFGNFCMRWILKFLFYLPWLHMPAMGAGSGGVTGKKAWSACCIWRLIFGHS